MSTDHQNTEVAAHYDAFCRKEWDRLGGRSMEFAVTLRFLEEHLPPPPARVIDIGSGPGRYALALAERSYAVTLVDISRQCLDWAQNRAQEQGLHFEEVLQKDGRDLDFLAEASFDAALLFGPLYHLLRHEERIQAVRSAHRLLRSGAPVFAAFINRYAPIRWAARRDPEWPARRPEVVRQLLQHGHLDPKPDKRGFIDAHCVHPDEIEPLMGAAGFHRRALVAPEALVFQLEDSLEDIPDQAWEAWVALSRELGTDPVLYGASDHLLYVGVK